jgi:ATP-dependent Clp protease adaptor protein ClpS
MASGGGLPRKELEYFSDADAAGDEEGWNVSTDLPLPEIVVTTRPKSREETHTRWLPPYHVVLHNDDFHSFEFVVDVLRKALGLSAERAYQLTLQAHTQGKAVVWTGAKEVAEFKADQVRTFHEVRARDGAKLGPLECTIEPAPAA